MCISIGQNFVAQSVAVHQYRAQLNRFTTLSSPGSQDLPPGLPAYVNPHIEHQENMSEDIFYISVRQAGHRVADYFGNACLQPGGCVSSVGLRDTVCKPSLRFMPHSKSFAPVQWVTSLLLYFKANF